MTLKLHGWYVQEYALRMPDEGRQPYAWQRMGRLADLRWAWGFRSRAAVRRHYARLVRASRN